MSVSHTKHRSDDRFAAQHADALHSQLLILHGDDVSAIECELADISVGGCAVRAKLDRDCDMTVAILRLQNETSGINLDVAGKLCWKQQTSVGCNSFGFRFRRPLDHDLIDRMVQQGLVTRRQNDRLMCGAEIDTRRTHGREPIQRAILEDCSATGVRLSLDVAPEIGERLLLTSQSGVGGSVNVVWVSGAGDMHQCGCTFVNLASARAINDAVTRAMA